jgi:serine/threonine protein kinase/formylglycine-generating enzyme required for sulfatase activity/cephalosporin-C deacetylase-like acetyl esterase
VTADRWEDVEKQLHQARLLAPDERAGFVANIGDEDVRAEVASLLAAEGGRGTSILRNAISDAASVAHPETFAGRVLGHFRIIKLLGRGAMGEVYLAQDVKLARQVALKLLPPAFQRDSERARRFEREARAAAALNHPNIVTVHEVGESDGQSFIATEFVEGETLADRLRRGPLTVAEAAQVSSQIAEALAAAHTAGIVHRDLKPANIMVRPDGTVKVLDFGLARLSRPAAEFAAEEAPTETATVPGRIMGTPHYMSPEQARGEIADARSDLWSLGVVVYESLAGRRPFEAPGQVEVLAAILSSNPTPLRSVNRRVPSGLADLVGRLLVKDRERRIAGAAEVAHGLKRFAENAAERKLRTRRRRWIAASILVVLAVAGASGSLLYGWSRRQWARYQAIPMARTLADKGDYAGAYRLAVQAARHVAGDPALSSLWPEVSRQFSVRTEPAGAEVQWKPYAELRSPWQTLGRTPVEKATLPAGAIRIRLVATGYEPVEVAPAGTEYLFDFKRAATLRPGMVLVPAGALNERIAGIGLLNVARLEEFELDRYEVTNRQFKDFIDRGGYERREYWKAPFLDKGRTLSREEAMARFRDPTGRPGPATWEAGTYPAGQDNHPVSGVSWYEAGAYAEFAGKDLPSVYHWVRAANIRGGPQDESWFMAPLSNFNSAGSKAVGSSAAVGSLGAYDLAGNVREWCQEEAGGRRYILGGSWADDSYMLARGQTAWPFDRSGTNGFRCVRYENPSLVKQALPPIVPDPRPDYDKARPVSDEVFASYMRLYAYAKKPLKPVVESVDESAELWRREKIRFQAPYGDEQIIGYLFLPKRGKPPYQCVFYFGGTDILQKGSGEKIQPVRYVLQSGRAMLYPIYKYALDRFSNLATDPVAQRDAMIMWRKDLAGSIDYLETRSDVNAGKLAYMGSSFGSRVSPMLLAPEDRIKAAILLSAGLRPHGWLPESDPVNFLPRMKIPTLMVTGLYDTILPVESAQQPMFRKLGTPAKDKRHVIFQTGHGVQGPEVRNQLVREVLDWLDRYLGRP